MKKIYYKQFSQKLYDENDSLGKECIRRIFSKIGYQILSYTKELYTHDVKIKKKNGSLIIVEVERRSAEHFESCWNQTYNNVHVPYRKKENISNWYIGLDADLSRGYKIDMSIIRELAEQKYIENKWCKNAGMDTFIMVPYKFVKYFYIKNDNIKWRQK